MSGSAAGREQGPEGAVDATPAKAPSMIGDVFVWTGRKVCGFEPVSALGDDLNSCGAACMYRFAAGGATSLYDVDRFGVAGDQ